MDPEENEAIGGLLSVADNPEPCGICVVHAVRAGVDYNTVPSDDIVGQKFGTGNVIHESVAMIGGTPVCWYHADDAAKTIGL